MYLAIHFDFGPDGPPPEDGGPCLQGAHPSRDLEWMFSFFYMYLYVLYVYLYIVLFVLLRVRLTASCCEVMR